MQIVPYAGWERCARFEFAGLEVYVTLEVGPRIIHYGPKDGKNLLFVSPIHAGKTGGEEFLNYGGHRLWVAPEIAERTLTPDNSPVKFREEDGVFKFTAPADKYFLQKEMILSPRPDGALEIQHRIYNNGAYPVEIALWAITVMDIGGELLIPNGTPVAEHGLLPVRPITLWSYTKMSDPRYTWGDRIIRLRQDCSRGPTKFGTLVDQGYAAYANNGGVFLKRFNCFDEGVYPDFGCNFESYTRHDMLEVESLDTLAEIGPGEYSYHDETWYWIPDTAPPEEEEACLNWLDELAQQRPLYPQI